MTHTVHEYNHGGVCIFCGYEKPATDPAAPLPNADELRGQIEYGLNRVTSTDGILTIEGQYITDWLMEIITTYAEQQVQQAKRELRDKFHIDADKKYKVLASESVIVITEQPPTPDTTEPL